MVFTAQNLADLQANNLKVSADGSVNTHNDININSSLEPGDTLTYDGTSWTNVPPGPVSVHSDVETSSPNIGDLLTWNGSNWANSPPFSAAAAGPINAHSDVETSLPSPGDLLTWNGSNWVNVPPGAYITPTQAADIEFNNLKVSADGPINQHSNVNTSAPSPGDLLAWDGFNWINIPASVGITPAQALSIIENSAKISADGPINTHSDVETSLPSPGDLLSWNGSQWVNVPPGTYITPAQAAAIEVNSEKVSASGPIETHNNITIANPGPGDILAWNGTGWTNQNAGIVFAASLD